MELDNMITINALKLQKGDKCILRIREFGFPSYFRTGIYNGSYTNANITNYFIFEFTYDNKTRNFEPFDIIEKIN